MAKHSRDKGKRGELEVVQLLKDHGFEARRGQQYQGGTDSPDVVHNMTDVGPAGFSFHLEVKRVEQLSLYQALEQAAQDMREDETPVVLHRRNGQEWVAILPAREFLDMVYCMKYPEEV